MTLNTNNQHISENELNQMPEQDMLLLAGSKVSLRDITQKEMDLPLSKNGKYYSANDVDNLFVLINGILTSVSEQAFRNDKALSEARKSIAENDDKQDVLQNQISELSDKVNKLSIENKLLKNDTSHQDELNNIKDELNDVKNKLDVKQSEYSRLLETSSSKMTEQSKQIDELSQENEDLKTQIKSLTDELQDVIQKPRDEGLQSDYDMLKYKYENLKTLSSQRIQDLTNQIKGES